MQNEIGKEPKKNKFYIQNQSYTINTFTWSKYRIMFNRFLDWRPVTKLCHRCWDERRHWGQQPTREQWLVSKLESYFYQQSTMSPNNSVTSTINKSMSLKLQERTFDLKTWIWYRAKPTEPWIFSVNSPHSKRGNITISDEFQLQNFLYLCKLSSTKLDLESNWNFLNENSRPKIPSSLQIFLNGILFRIKLKHSE